MHSSKQIIRSWLISWPFLINVSTLYGRLVLQSLADFQCWLTVGRVWWHLCLHYIILLKQCFYWFQLILQLIPMLLLIYFILINLITYTYINSCFGVFWLYIICNRQTIWLSLMGLHCVRTMYLYKCRCFCFYRNLIDFLYLVILCQRILLQ